MISQFGSLGYTIMGKTADLTVVQKTIIDTLHKEGKPQTFIAKEAGCSQSAVSKHVNRKLRVRKKCGETHSPSCLKSSVKFPQSVMIWGAMSSAGVGSLCKNQHHCTRLPRHFGAVHASFSFLKMLISFSIRIWHLPTLPKDQGVGVLDWPANSPDLNPIENLWVIVKRNMRNKRPKNADELKATVKETWASIPPQQFHKLITSMPHRNEAVIKAKGAPTKYWVHIQ